jgi:hypothetical protein
MSYRLGRNRRESTGQMEPLRFLRALKTKNIRLKIFPKVRKYGGMNEYFPGIGMEKRRIPIHDPNGVS